MRWSALCFTKKKNTRQIAPTRYARRLSLNLATFQTTHWRAMRSCVCVLLVWWICEVCWLTDSVALYSYTRTRHQWFKYFVYMFSCIKFTFSVNVLLWSCIEQQRNICVPRISLEVNWNLQLVDIFPIRNQFWLENGAEQSETLWVIKRKIKAASIQLQ